MAHRVVWSRRALQDVEAIAEYIARDDDDVRELLAYNYRIIYSVQETQVVISAVIHGKRILQ